MPLDIGLAEKGARSPSPNWPIVSFDGDDNAGYFCFLHPFFSRLAEQTGQVIDLYDDAEFQGEDVELFRQTILEAREAVTAQPERWFVRTGIATMPNAPNPPPPREIIREVERSKLLASLDALLSIIDLSVETGRRIVCFGD